MSYREDIQQEVIVNKSHYAVKSEKLRMLLNVFVAL